MHELFGLEWNLFIKIYKSKAKWVGWPQGQTTTNKSQLKFISVRLK